MPKRKQEQQEEDDCNSENQEAEEILNEPSLSTSGSDSDFSSSESEDGSDEESEDDEDGEAFESINVDFEFFNPQEKDFHGLKALLKTLLDGEQYSCSELVDAIIEQEAVGTVIKCGEEEDPIGVSTVFNLQQYSRLKSLSEVKDFLAAHCPVTDDKAHLDEVNCGLSQLLVRCPGRVSQSASHIVEKHALRACVCIQKIANNEGKNVIACSRRLRHPGNCWSAGFVSSLQCARGTQALGNAIAQGSAMLVQWPVQAWAAPGTGLLISERLINCPPQLAPPLQQNLFEEIKAAAEEEDTEELRNFYRFSRFIMVARVYVDPEEQSDSEGRQLGGQAGKQRKGKKQKQVALMPSLIYTTPEAECFHSVSDWSFSFPNPNRLVGKHDAVPHRLVMCVDAGKVPKALKQLEVLVAAGAGNNNE